MAGVKDDQTKKFRPDGASNSEISSYVDSSEKNSPVDSSAEPTESVINNESSNEALVVDCDSPSNSNSQGTWALLFLFNGFKLTGKLFLMNFPVLFSLDDLGTRRRRHPPRGAKRGRPRGSRRGGGTGSLGRLDSSTGSTGGKYNFTFDFYKKKYSPNPTFQNQILKNTNQHFNLINYIIKFH